MSEPWHSTLANIETVARGTRVGLRPFRDDAEEYARMVRWLSDPLVLEWYEGRDRPHDLGMVLATYGPGGEHAHAGVHQAIIEQEGVAAGYLQYYPVSDAAAYGIADAANAWAVDLFIGEPAHWSRGIGSAVLAALAGHLFTTEGAARVLIDPRVVNERAIRAYEKAGFRKVKVLRDHEEHEGRRWDNWLMDAVPPEAQAGM